MHLGKTLGELSENTQNASIVSPSCSNLLKDAPDTDTELPALIQSFPYESTRLKPG